MIGLHELRPRTLRKQGKRVGRGGKRGTTSGHGTKGQTSRAGSSVKPGFRGGDNRIWQMFPKLRGASKKHGNAKPHRKHGLFQLKQGQAMPVSLDALNVFSDGDVVTREQLMQKGLVPEGHGKIKVLGGALNRKLTLQGLRVSASAKAAIEKAGGSVQHVIDSPPTLKLRKGTSSLNEEMPALRSSEGAKK